jgi:hypothetical protein
MKCEEHEWVESGAVMRDIFLVNAQKGLQVGTCGAEFPIFGVSAGRIYVHGNTQSFKMVLVRHKSDRLLAVLPIICDSNF